MSDPGGSFDAPLRSDGGEPDSLHRVQRLVNAVDDGIYRLDPEGRFVSVNDAILDASGYSREDLLGSHVSSVIAEADADRLEREIRTRLETGADPGSTFELSVETADGDRLPCELRFTLLREDGTFEGTAGVIRPIDDRTGRGAREQLPSIWETYDSISSVIDEADVGVFVLDDDFDVVWIDETVEEYFDIDRSAVVGRDKRTLIEETIRDRLADAETFVETVTATYDDNTYVERFECRITPGEGREERWLEHRSKPIESGRYAGGRIELYYDITDRKTAERARKESERRFETLVDAVEEYAIFMLDPEGTVVSWNDGAERIKGYDADEILGEHLSRFYTDEDRADGMPERNLAKARALGTIEEEGWRVRKDGSQFWANMTITTIREDGELRGYAKVTRDLTDRREREEQLRREHDLTERILETSPVGIAVVDADGSTERANDRMADLLDLPPEEIGSYEAGQRDMYDADGTFLPVEERPAGQAFERGEPIFDREILIDPSDGQRRWLSMNATPITDDDGEPTRVVATATEITELKELAQRRKRDLREREKELAAIRVATDLLDTGGRPVDQLLEEFVANLPQFFRYPARTATRVSVGDEAVANDGYASVDRSIAARTRTESGTEIAIDVALLDDPPRNDDAAFLEEERKLIDTIATLLKAHFDRREYVDELRESNARLEQFAYAASHDLQEPLRMVSSYLQLLERRYADELDEDGEEFIAYAVDGAERMREMIEGLLGYSRVESRGDPFEPVDLEAVLADVRDDLEIQIDAQDAVISMEALPTVEGDASQLRQVFQNLLDNAIQYSGDEPPRVHVAAERRGDEWEVSVRDEGIGIDVEDQERVFEVFQRLHTREEHDGTGIGLALCERIVERHGGEIRVESAPGEGATFTLTLPAVKES
ncbi:PAS domain S-box protein [Halovivax sp.]|uniref:PAS domain-containing sensor histidine kinase n=1 Tax=Halovivax sp. TaxID=1935978 RepID=UPI0025C22AE9|nr:PAS domain S-box protein [Halovivax sp.]